MEKTVLGAQLYTLRDYCKTIDDIRGTLKRVAEIGYKRCKCPDSDPCSQRTLPKQSAMPG